MGVRWVCPRCQSDLLAELETVAREGACPRCRAALDKRFARRALLRFEFGQGLGIGFLAAIAAGVLAIVAAGLAGGIADHVNPLLVVGLPAGLAWVGATGAYWRRAWRRGRILKSEF